MSRHGPMLQSIAAVAVLLAVASCSPVFTYHGFVPTEEDLGEIEVGLDTRSSVASIIGKPGASGLLEESGWYYVRSEFEHAPVRGPQEIDRQVVAISFDEANMVTNVERFGLERGQVVVLSRRVTDSNIEGVSFLGQLFGSTASAANISRLFTTQ
ncbi:MAG TPA: outer membrane protein assembly factor BamE [Rhodobacteraceae bacterium]|nr:outer membrane protein assembly factor BamE [Paracoccaceae bacterium]